MPKLSPQEQAELLALIQQSDEKTKTIVEERVTHLDLEQDQVPVLQDVERELKELRRRKEDAKERRYQIIRLQVPYLYVIRVDSYMGPAILSKIAFTTEKRAKAAIRDAMFMESSGITVIGSNRTLSVERVETLRIPEDMIRNVDKPITLKGVGSIYEIKK